jgi:hypothetical protein
LLTSKESLHVLVSREILQQLLIVHPMCVVRSVVSVLMILTKSVATSLPINVVISMGLSIVVYVRIVILIRL